MGIGMRTGDRDKWRRRRRRKERKRGGGIRKGWVYGNGDIGTLGIGIGRVLDPGPALKSVLRMTLVKGNDPKPFLGMLGPGPTLKSIPPSDPCQG